MEVTKNIKFLPAGTTQYLVDAEYDIINVDTSASAVSIVFPNIKNNGYFGAGKCFTINDVANNAATNNITIGAIGNTVNSQSSVNIDTDGGSAKVSIASLDEWFVVIEPSQGGSSAGTVFFVETTYANLVTLQSTNLLVPGTFYKITDRADAGIIIQAESINQLSVQGSGIFLNPDYNDVGDYSGVTALTGIPKESNYAVWTAAKEAFMINGDVVVYNGIQYEAIDTANFDGNPPGTQTPAAYFQLDKTEPNVGYITETDFITYDFINDVIISREDKRGNKISNDISSFQWGNPNCLKNVVSSIGSIQNINQTSTCIGNTVLNGTLILGNTHGGTFNNNTLDGGSLSITGNVNAGAFVNNCNFLISGITIVFPLTSTYTGKTITSFASDFTATLSMASVFSAGALTIPSNLNFVAGFVLSGSSGSTITSIINLPPIASVEFVATAGENQIFSHTSVATATANQLVSDTATTNTIVGRINGKDFICYRTSGNLKERVNIVKLA